MSETSKRMERCRALRLERFARKMQNIPAVSAAAAGKAAVRRSGVNKNQKSPPQRPCLAVDKNTAAAGQRKQYFILFVKMRPFHMPQAAVTALQLKIPSAHGHPPGHTVESVYHNLARYANKRAQTSIEACYRLPYNTGILFFRRRFHGYSAGPHPPDDGGVCRLSA